MYTLSLHDALPIFGDVDDGQARTCGHGGGGSGDAEVVHAGPPLLDDAAGVGAGPGQSGGRKGHIEPLRAHEGRAACFAAAPASRSWPAPAASARWAASRASTARSTRGSCAGPLMVMSPPDHEIG